MRVDSAVEPCLGHRMRSSTWRAYSTPGAKMSRFRSESAIPTECPASRKAAMSGAHTSASPMPSSRTMRILAIVPQFSLQFVDVHAVEQPPASETRHDGRHVGAGGDAREQRLGGARCEGFGAQQVYSVRAGGELRARGGR